MGDWGIADFLKCEGIGVPNLMGLETSPKVGGVIIGIDWREVGTP